MSAGKAGSKAQSQIGEGAGREHSCREARAEGREQHSVRSDERSPKRARDPRRSQSLGPNYDWRAHVAVPQAPRDAAGQAGIHGQCEEGFKARGKASRVGEEICCSEVIGGARCSERAATVECCYCLRTVEEGEATAHFKERRTYSAALLEKLVAWKTRNLIV